MICSTCGKEITANEDVFQIGRNTTQLVCSTCAGTAETSDPEASNEAIKP